MQNKGLFESIFPKLLMEMADNMWERLTFKLTNFKFKKKKPFGQKTLHCALKIKNL